MKNKVLSLILALLMAASSASAVLAEEAIADVDDVVDATVEEAEAGQYDKAIKFLNAYGIFKGKSADDLGAEDMLERYQMALFVARVSTGYVDDEKWEDGPENWSEFTDISEGPVANYWGALSYANQKGIIEGYGNGKFGPTDGITYQNALTMTVRTLGYTGLEWPWGYIEKAVSLGLTDGITDVAYTQELNRGEVAQILYNALFATTKAGTTLAMSSFGIEFGWEKVVITASDLDIFTQDHKDAALADPQKNAYQQYNDKSYRVADGFVSFKLLNDDGTLGDDTYYMLGSEIGLSAEDNMHDDEAVVGDAYYLMFEKNADDDLVDVVAVESLYTETLWNFGKTDNDGDAQDYEIKEYLKKNTLVDKYTTSEYVNITAKKYPELMVFDKTGTIEEKVVNGNLVAIDWSTGDILIPVDDDKDGKWDTDADKNYEYTVKYHYLPLLDTYYQVLVDDDYGVIGWDLMDDKELADLLDAFKVEETKYRNGFNKAITDSKIGDSAYASLELFDTDLDGVADRGIYEHYRLGKFTEDTYDCGKGCGAQLSYKISDVGTLGNAIKSSDVKPDEKLDEKGIDVFAKAFETLAEGVVCSHTKERAWFVEGYEPTVAYDEDGDATGYKAGYVIYSYDAETGAIKVVKNIEDGSDDDSFVATGVVRAYNTKTGSVTIDETPYSIKSYDELEGNGFKYVDDNTETRGQYTGLLRTLFNQFVTYVVVDGELVHIEPCGNTSSDIIIVDSYAGLDSDGYIVVNGYLASELKYKQFRIGSYDGWEKGDYYYYLDRETAEESFDKGTIYEITSRDAKNDVYYVNLAGEWNRATGEYTVEKGDQVTPYPITISPNGDGYMNVAITGKTSGDLKMKDADTYIVIPKTVNGNPYASIIKYVGKLDDDWSIEGDVINTTDYDKRTYIIVNADVVAGVDFYGDNINAGLVLLLDDRATSISYNGADAETPYLLGASVFEYEVVDLFTGNLHADRVATNKSLKEHHVYFTQGNVIVEDNGVANIAALMNIATRSYPEIDVDYATYLLGRFAITEDTAAAFFGQNVDKNDKTDDARLFIGNDAGIYSYQAKDWFNGFADLYGVNAYYKGIIDGIEYRFITHDDDNTMIETVEKISWTEFKELVEDVEDYTYFVYFVYDVENYDMVCYISKEAEDNRLFDEAEKSTPTEKIIVAEVGSDALANLGVDIEDIEVNIKASADYKKVTDEDGDLVGVVVETINFEFGGKTLADATHANIAEWNMYFGEGGVCTAQDLFATFEEYTAISDEYKAYIAAKHNKKVTDIESIAIKANFSDMSAKAYAHVVESECTCIEAAYEGDCNLIQSIKVPVELLVKFVGVDDAVVEPYYTSEDFEFTVNLVDSDLINNDGYTNGIVEDLASKLADDMILAAESDLVANAESIAMAVAALDGVDFEELEEAEFDAIFADIYEDLALISITFDKDGKAEVKENEKVEEILEDDSTSIEDKLEALEDLAKEYDEAAKTFAAIAADAEAYKAFVKAHEAWEKDIAKFEKDHAGENICDHHKPVEPKFKTTQDVLDADDFAERLANVDKDKVSQLDKDIVSWLKKSAAAKAMAADVRDAVEFIEDTVELLASFVAGGSSFDLVLDVTTGKTSAVKLTVEDVAELLTARINLVDLVDELGEALDEELGETIPEVLGAIISTLF